MNLTKECLKSPIGLGICESHMNRSMSRVNPNPINPLTCSLVHPSHPLSLNTLEDNTPVNYSERYYRKLFQHIFLSRADFIHCHLIPCQVLYFKRCIPEVKINTIQPQRTPLASQSWRTPPSDICPSSQSCTTKALPTKSFKPLSCP